MSLVWGNQSLFSKSAGSVCFASHHGTLNELIWFAAVLVCTHMYLFMRSPTHAQCVFFILSTPCHLPPPSPSPLVVQLGETGLESKVQVCRSADESQRGCVPPTVSKYVVDLNERRSGTQQLFISSFVRECVSAPRTKRKENKFSTGSHTPGIQWLLRGEGCCFIFLRLLFLTLSPSHTHTQPRWL